jgi:DeoR/GlpR family transcriptional regulator of sugar metabolism
MKKVERKFKINLTINKKGQVSIEELTKTFNVTSETIRRDLQELEDEHLIQKVHGGALSLQNNTEDSLHDRFYQNVKAKEIIAQKTISKIKPHSRIFIDFGSTTLAFCEELNKIDNLTIFTNSPLLAKTVYEANHSHDIYILGGKYLANLHENVGYLTLNSIKNEFVDLSIISTASINLKYGFFNINQDEAEIAKEMIKNSKECMLLADDSKINRKGIWKICSFREIDYLVCNKYNSDLDNICKTYNIEYI